MSSAQKPAGPHEDNDEGVHVLLNDLSMDEAVAMAARNHTSDGNAPLTTEQVQEARSKAQTLLQGMSGDGLSDMRKLTLSLGMPAAKLALIHLIDYGAAPDPMKASLKNSVNGLYPDIPEKGCQQVDFFNKKKGAMDAAYLVLDECPSTHNLTAQLDKLAPHIPPEKRPEIMKHLTALVFVGRSVFAKVVKENRDLVRDILQFLPAADKIDCNAMHVDPNNTTLCVHPRTPKRVGIFVILSDEAEAAALKTKASDTKK